MANYYLATPIGDVVCIPTRKDHVYVDCTALGCKVNSKKVRFNLHMHLRDGGWTDKGSNGITTFYAYDDITNLQQKKLLAEVVSAVIKWIFNNSDAMLNAQKEWNENKRDNLEREKRDLLQRVAEIDKQI